MELIKSVNAATDTLELINDPRKGVVLYADADTLVTLQYDPEAPISHGGEDNNDEPAWVIWTYVSTAHPKVVDGYYSKDQERVMLQWNGVSYPMGTTDINDLTPVASTDTGGVYPSFDTMYANWTNPQSEDILDLLSSIRQL